MKKDPYISLAKKTIESWIKSGKQIKIPENLPPKVLTERAGVFVSIHKKSSRGRSASGRDGSLRGCIGTFLPTKENTAQEIIANAIAAATRDPRFPSVKLEELPDLEISVDILSKPKKLDAKRYTLDPKKYGLIVSTNDGRRGLLLPDIPGVETAEEQIAICRRKAGIGPDEPIKLEVFTVERHSKD